MGLVLVALVLLLAVVVVAVLYVPLWCEAVQCSWDLWRCERVVTLCALAMDVA